jgi:hypothetical protein
MKNKQGLITSLPNGKFEDLTGQVFGQLTVISFSGTESKPYGNLRWWSCRCSCGNMTDVITTHLKRGAVVSCGCWRKKIAVMFLTKHGSCTSKGPTPEYTIWTGMLSRTTCTTNQRYPDYGGRGIRVCKRWRRSFQNFLNDMGPRPSPKHSIDRINNSKGYSPENCRWVTRDIQARNTRVNVRLTFRGETKCVAEWAETMGMPRALIYSRVGKLGWDAERALTAPIQYYHPKQS